MAIALVTQRLLESSEIKKRVAAEQAEHIARAGQAIARALANDGKVLFFGNGGSAADAQHIAAEFVGRFIHDRVPLSALALTTDTSALTAIGNDYGFEQIFARQMRALGKPGDVAVAISTSGQSANVLTAVEAARERHITTIGLTGHNGGRLAKEVDIAIIVASESTARIQECHITIAHILCEIAENILFNVETPASASPTASTLQLTPPNSKHVDWDTLLALRQRWRSEKKVVVWTNGCFDLLHAGHVRSLQAARSMGDVLVVGVNSDASVRHLKGPGRPVMAASARVEVLAALACTDYVIVFEEHTPETALSRLQPNIHCKGAEYASQDGKPIPEANVVASYGGRIEFFPMVPDLSTSKLIEHIQEQSQSNRDALSGVQL